MNYKDIANRTGINPLNVSLNNKFFSSNGFIVEETRGSYKLTEKGFDYAKLLDWGRLIEAGNKLAEILKEAPPFQIAIDYMSINKQATRDDLIAQIATFASVKKTRAYITGINSMIDMLVFSGILKEDDGKLIFMGEKEREKKVESTQMPAEKLVEELPTRVTFRAR